VSLQKQDVLDGFSKEKLAKIVEDTFKIQGQLGGTGKVVYTTLEVKRRVAMLAGVLLELKFDAGQSNREAMISARSILVERLFGLPAKAVSEYKGGVKVKGEGVTRSGKAKRSRCCYAADGGLHVPDDVVVQEKDTTNPSKLHVEVEPTISVGASGKLYRGKG